MKTIKLMTVCFSLLFFAIEATASNEYYGHQEVEEDVVVQGLEDFDPDGPKYGKDSISCVRNLSLYREHYRQRNFEDAIVPWRQVFFNCPLSSQNMYLDGAVMRKHLFNQAATAEEKERHVDTLMMLYDRRIKAFGREGFVLGRKGVDKFYMSPPRVEEAYKTLKRSIEIEQNNSRADVVVAFFQAAIRLSDTHSYPKETVLDAYMTVYDIINYNLIHNVADTHFVAAQRNVDILFDPLANCSDIVEIYTQRFNKTPDDKELLERISVMLNKYGCQDEDLFFEATAGLHKIEPTAKSAYLMGNMLYSREEYRKASQFFQEAVKLYDADEINSKADAYLKLAEIHFRRLNQLSRARSFALNAAELRPKDGRPLLLIGDMYANSASSCGENDFEKKTGYWAAVDKFIQARNIDDSPSVQSAASQRISTWSQYFPDDELIFFHGYEKGQSYQVGCWINETTTVR